MKIPIYFLIIYNEWSSFLIKASGFVQALEG